MSPIHTAPSRLLVLAALTVAAYAQDRNPIGHTIDRVHVNQLDDEGRTWARGRTYKASFGRDGFCFVPFLGSEAPRNWPVQFALEGVYVGGAQIDIALDTPAEVEGMRVRRVHGPLVEHYDLHLESVEQGFTLMRPLGAGDLEIALAVETDMELVELEYGSGFGFRCPDGGVDYGAATVFDAAGRSLQIETTWGGGEVRIRVPAAFFADAAWPVVVDPVVTGFLIDDFSASLLEPQVAHDRDTDSFLVAYTEVFSASDWDVYARRITIDGQLLGGGYVDSSTNHWGRFDVASCAASGVFVIAAPVRIGNTLPEWIHTRPWEAATDTIGTGWAYVDPGMTASYPSIGGDDLDGFCLVWRRENMASGQAFVSGRLLDETGAPGPIFGVTGSFQGTANICKNSGGAPYGTSKWLVAWSDQVGSEYRINGRTIRWDGQLGPVVTIAAGNLPLGQYSVSSPTNTVGDRRYVVAYTRDFGFRRDVYASLWSAGSTLHTVDVSASFPMVFGDSEFSPDVDCDGHHWVIAATQRSLSTGSSFSSFATTYVEVDGALRRTEPVAQIFFGASITDARVVPRGPSEYSPDWLIALTDYSNSPNSNIFGARWHPNWSPLGSHFCSSEATPNTTGGSSLLVARGSGVAGGTIELQATQLPTGVSGYLVGSSNFTTSGGFTPFGSSGFFCLQQPFARFLGTLQNSGNQGAMHSVISTASIPLTPPVSVLPGQTWGFQFWHRDLFNAGSNFTNGVWVQFQ